MRELARADAQKNGGWVRSSLNMTYKSAENFCSVQNLNLLTRANMGCNIAIGNICNSSARITFGNSFSGDWIWFKDKYTAVAYPSHYVMNSGGYMTYWADNVPHKALCK